MSTSRSSLAFFLRALLDLVLVSSALGTSASAGAQDPVSVAGIPPAINCALLPTAADWGGNAEAPTHVDAATVIGASADSPAYCQVTGYIASQVQFELHLPVTGCTGQGTVSC